MNSQIQIHQFTFSDCITRANECMQAAFRITDLALEKNSKLYFKAAENRANEAQAWFNLAAIARKQPCVRVVFSANIASPILVKGN